MTVPTIDELVQQAQYEQHPYGKVWQPFDQDTFGKLADDLDRRGLDQEILLYQGMILDGWHRYLACLAAKVKPIFKEFNGTDLEAAELVHASGIRRHIASADQRYAAFSLLCDQCPAFKKKYEELKAKGEQQKQEGKALATDGQRVDVVGSKAKAANVGKSTAKKIEKVKKENPGAVAEIAAGRTTANKELEKLKVSGKKKQATVKGESAKEQSAKPERPTISELVQIIYRGLEAAKEVDGLEPKKNSLHFRLNGYRVKVSCSLVK